MNKSSLHCLAGITSTTVSCPSAVLVPHTISGSLYVSSLPRLLAFWRAPPPSSSAPLATHPFVCIRPRHPRVSYIPGDPTSWNLGYEWDIHIFLLLPPTSISKDINRTQAAPSQTQLAPSCSISLQRPIIRATGALLPKSIASSRQRASPPSHLSTCHAWSCLITSFRIST